MSMGWAFTQYHTAHVMSMVSNAHAVCGCSLRDLRMLLGALMLHNGAKSVGGGGEPQEIALGYVWGLRRCYSLEWISLLEC